MSEPTPNESPDQTSSEASLKAYWLGRWKRGETGWHQTEPEGALVRNFSDLAPTRVLVPLCGMSLDLAWLASRGHQVVGVEWSKLACRRFFDENRIPYVTSSMRNLEIFSGGGVRLLNADFFDLLPSDIGAIGAIYDRAALIALPAEERVRYATRLSELTRALANRTSFRMLQLVLERTPPDKSGPPYCVPERELRQLYGSEFEIIPVSREKVDLRPGNSGHAPGNSGHAPGNSGHAPGNSGHAEECVYELRLRGP